MNDERAIQNGLLVFFILVGKNYDDVATREFGEFE